MTSTTAQPTFTVEQMPARSSSCPYNLPIGYLRAFVTVLVLAFHSVLAYDVDAPPPPHSLIAQPRWWMAFPIVDPHRWSGFSLFVGFNEIFFMSLMFFLSGLFVWNSLERKGSRIFLRDRGLRLGVPFVAAAAIVAPIAYYSAYLQTAGPHSINNYVHQWLSLGEWPSGPAWFVWVLLVFDCIAAALFAITPKAGKLLGRLSAQSSHGPIGFFALLLTMSAFFYIPMALAVNPLSWSAFGPFQLQTSRILHYLIYFMAGISVGAFGISGGLLAPAGKLARRWLLWVLGALTAFVAAVIATVLAFTNYQHAPYMWGFIAGCGFVLSCAASCFALLALFVRFARVPHRVFGHLRDNAYGMYLIHYVFVSWVQYSLLRFMWPGLAKGAIAFLAVLVLSTFTTALLRRVPAIQRVI